MKHPTPQDIDNIRERLNDLERDVEQLNEAVSALAKWIPALSADIARAAEISLRTGAIRADNIKEIKTLSDAILKNYETLNPSGDTNE